MVEIPLVLPIVLWGGFAFLHTKRTPPVLLPLLPLFDDFCCFLSGQRQCLLFFVASGAAATISSFFPTSHPMITTSLAFYRPGYVPVPACLDHSLP